MNTSYSPSEYIPSTETIQRRILQDRTTFTNAVASICEDRTVGVNNRDLFTRYMLLYARLADIRKFLHPDLWQEHFNLLLIKNSWHRSLENKTSLPREKIQSWLRTTAPKDIEDLQTALSYIADRVRSIPGLLPVSISPDFPASSLLPQKPVSYFPALRPVDDS